MAAQKKSVLITGCSEGGVGDALARVFHRKGLRVFATARNLKKIQHLNALGVEILQLDVTDSLSIANAVQAVSNLTNGTLDILINNSGNGYTNPLLDSPENAFHALFSVNVLALITVTTAFSPLLISTKGTLVNVGSGSGKSPLPWNGLYNASKAAANLLSDQFRVELAPFDVKVMLVMSGGIRTKFFANQINAGDKNEDGLPQGSRYEAVKEEIEIIKRGEGILEGNMDVEVYAENFAEGVLKGKKKHLWIGTNVWIVWIFSLLVALGWNGVWDWALKRTPPYTMSIVDKKIREGRK